VDAFSPKAALSWQATPSTVLKASVGRAVRMPTVNELYGATSTTSSQFVNEPDLAPERSWTGELSAEHDFEKSRGRLTFFAEDTRDAIYAQTVFDDAANKNISRVQNIGRIATTGLEAALASQDWLADGLDLSGSLTWADSRIRGNAGFVAIPGDTIGKRQPNIPRWRATALASWRFATDWTGSVGARYSGRQYRTLNNADVNGDAYMGVSRFFVVDVRATWKFAPRWTAALGVDNLNDCRYWNFHPYPQRTTSAELKYDL
jgi:iron complex outermembrane receptor protein